MSVRVPPIEVSRPLLLGLVAAGALLAVGGPEPVTCFAAGFAAGAGTVFVVSFLKNPRRPRGDAPRDPR